MLPQVERKLSSERSNDTFEQSVQKSILGTQEKFLGIEARSIREVIFGIEDGLITTLSVVLGVSGAVANNRIVIVAGIAALLAEAISMSAGAYLSTKSQREFFERKLADEFDEIRHKPHEEREEIRQIYKTKGFTGNQLEAIVEQITSDRELWLREMAAAELGLIPERFENPVRTAIIFLASSMSGVIPLLPYFFLNLSNSIIAAVLGTMLILFGAGSLKSKLTKTNWMKSGFEMLAIGMLAGVLGYIVGMSLKLVMV